MTEGGAKRVFKPEERIEIMNSPFKPKRAPEGYRWVAHHRKEGKVYAWRLDTTPEIKVESALKAEKKERSKPVEQLEKEYVQPPLTGLQISTKTEGVED